MEFKYVNMNPLNAIESDCVCRAISLGVNEDYEIIEEKLHLIAQLFECEELCACCYKHLLESVYGLRRIQLNERLTIEEFLQLNPIGVYIIRVEGHLTCGIDGKLCDTWNCKDKLVDLVWIVE